MLQSTAPPAAAPSMQAGTPPSAPPVVTIPPVLIGGDATHQLVKNYDQKAAALCSNERNAAIAGCTNIGAALIDESIPAAGTSSLICVQLIATYDNCKDVATERLKFADRCEARDGIALASARPNEVVCWER